MILKILLGLIGLGIVVLVHEAGHFAAALLAGIEVEAFSIGWGPALVHKEIRGIEFRIGAFPVGGYCRMRGEQEFRSALTGKNGDIPSEKGTFFGAGPWRRIGVALAGPAGNFLFSIIVLACVWGIGFKGTTLGNKIVLASQYESETTYPADKAGLKTGDKIKVIEGKRVTNYQEIQEALAPHAGKQLDMTVERAGASIDLTIVPKLDKETGAGKIGVYFWTDPVVGSIVPGSPADIAGLQSGDKIRAVDGVAIPHSIAFFHAFSSKPRRAAIDFSRDGEEKTTTILVSYDEGGGFDLGLRFKSIEYHSPKLSFIGAIEKGFSETWKTFTYSLSGLSTLFKGVDVTKAVSGPVRLTYMVGEVAQEGFGEGIGQGFLAVASFLSFLSVALFMMNLLPLPALDGGMIVLFLAEGIRRRPLKAKTFYFFQTAGAIIIFSLLLFSMFGDILFLINR